MQYTLHQLKIFLKVAEHHSITKACEELFLTQPAVSIQLKKFQEQFSVPLFEVIGKKIYITEFGEEVAKSATNILDELEIINYKTKSFEGRLAGKLKISVASKGKYIIPYFLTEFLHLNPGIDLIMDVNNSAGVIKGLEENKVDFALLPILPENLKIKNIELLENKLHLVGGGVIETDSVKSYIKLFETYPLILREKGSATRDAMEEYIKTKNLPVFKKIVLTSNEAVKQALIAGLGFSIMPIIGLKNELKSGSLKILNLRGLPIITTWNLVWLESKKLSPIASSYLDYFKKNKDRIIERQFSWIKDY
jgi:DNA-binding transcriptional LysR family regulator